VAADGSRERPERVAYEAPGWGRGEIWLDQLGRVLWHEAPSARNVALTGFHPLGERMMRYFGGAAADFDDVTVVDDELSGFQRELLVSARNLERAQVVTYGELAAAAGRPRAARAAGTFCAQNRFSVIVPCHRVVASTGIGGYGPLGVGYKQRLLELEGWSA